MTTKVDNNAAEAVPVTTAARIAKLSPEQQQVLIARIRKKGKTNQSKLSIPLINPEVENVGHPFPLTESQEVLWLGRSGVFDLGACGTNLLMEIEFTDVPDNFLGLLQKALNRLVKRHPMLRTIILPEGRQQILPLVPDYLIKREDLTSLDDISVVSCLEMRREQMRSYNGPLNRWPLFEIETFQLKDGRFRMMARFEATIVDGGSRIILLQELIALMKLPQARFPETSFTYRDYALAAHSFRSHPLWQSSRDYWHRRLDTLPPPPKIAYRRAPLQDDPAPSISRIVKLLNLREWEVLKARAARLGITPTGLACCVFSGALAQHTSSDAFTVGLIGSLRLPFHADVSSVIGNFNTLSLLQVDAPFESFVPRAQKLQHQLARDLENQYFSGFQVLRELRRRYPSCHAMLPVCFNSVLEYSSPSHQYWKVAGNNSQLPYRMVELNLVLPQVVMMFTVADTDGFLACKCQTLDEILPVDFATNVIESCIKQLEIVFHDEKIWFSEVTARSVFESSPRADETLQCCSEKRQIYEKQGAKKGVPKTYCDDSLEDRITSLWQDILGQPFISIEDDFFKLGGDSFTLVVMLSSLERALNRKLKIDKFWHDATIRCLCDLISSEGNDEIPLLKVQ
ncbi:MAG TPA: condensation domain-containing protein [Candidatus Angelobacter sp.]|nr:condensation domain-containing protein [Candidatus Angelobacter sp.]